VNKADETRNFIIEKAAPIFNMHCYRGTTMSQLTEAINMTKEAICDNFSDKDEIALAAFDYNFVEISKQIADTDDPVTLVLAHPGPHSTAPDIAWHR
jgi:AcrR family transcriptional regulator